MSYRLRVRSLNIDPKRINLAEIETRVRVYMQGYLDDLIRGVRKYPPAPAESTYVRTFNLYDSWHADVRRTARGFEGSITNSASDRDSGRRYMRYVQGPWQTSGHDITGWLRIDEFARATRAAYRAGLQAIYTSAIKQGA